MALCQSCNRYVEPRSSRLGLPDSTSTASAIKEEKIYQEYKYDRFQKYRGYIRVVILLGNGSHNADVECEIVAIPFRKENQVEHPYEALSWCWGSAKPSGRVFVRKGKKDKRRLVKAVTPDLVAALRALRYRGKDRYLWVDQISINQNDPLEKNHQVEMMSEIFGRASRVCIWLGDGDRSSRMALEFIKTEVLQLQNFDELCESEQASEKWGALLDLMQRPWFSRRWVVQEIALAFTAVVYCGTDKISWKKFAVAVELFVEVETATHRLSEVMKKDPRFYHVPGWFEYVSALGASLLVEATSKLFRDYKPNGPAVAEGDSDGDTETETDEEEDEEDDDPVVDSELMTNPQIEASSSNRSLGQPLLTLEYLVSSLSIFEVTTPHDAVYALLAIARDTTPLAIEKDGRHRPLDNTQEVFEGFTQKKRYKVDYQQPFADVCKEFVAFCIERSKDRSRALDIICRPWSPDIASSDKRSATNMKKSKKSRRASITRRGPPKLERSSTAAANASQNNGTSKESSTRTPQRSTISPGKTKASLTETRSYPAKDVEDNIPLPSWIPSLSGAPYAMYSQAGVHTLKMGRKNADTLVGLPPSNQSLERNYNAAETKGVDLKTLRFVKRPKMEHWCMYVKGFVLDEVLETQPSSQGGAIPRSWAKVGGWFDVPHSDPPNDFWRTLVADRGRDGRNPPVYYSRACKESFAKGGLSSGSVNTTDLINNERCSVVAQFCRRVQAVIWNRCLIKTKTGRLGLGGQDVQRGDIVCILYGCSVPMVLRRIRKRREDVYREADNDATEYLMQWKASIMSACKRRTHRRLMRTLERLKYHLWKEAKETEREALPFKKPRVDWHSFLLQQKWYRRWRRIIMERKRTNRLKRPQSSSPHGTLSPENGILDGTRTNGSIDGAADRSGIIVSQSASDVPSPGENQQLPDDAKESVDDPNGVANEQVNGLLNSQQALGADTDVDGAQAPSNAIDRSNHVDNGWKKEQQVEGAAVAASFARRNTSTTTPPPRRSELFVNMEHSYPASDAYLEPLKKKYLAHFHSSKSATNNHEPEEPDWSIADESFGSKQGKADLKLDREALRHQDHWSYYVLLGECYVHGMMDGEAMAYQNANDKPARVFELR